jgi:hypothetical protein
MTTSRPKRFGSCSTTRLRKENRILREEREIPKKAGTLFEAPAVKFAGIAA